jgi:DNA-binding MarR family transcriptional regulator
MEQQERVNILKSKLKRQIKASDLPKVTFLAVIASHDGLVMADSVSTSFHEFNQRYGNEKFDEVLKDLKEDGVITEKHGLKFYVVNERGEYDYKAGEELSKYVGELIFECIPQIKQVIDEIAKEPEGNEFLKSIAKEKGVNIFDGQDPKIKDIVGKRTYELLVEKLVKNDILVEYAWSSRKHSCSGYKLLPFVDYYLRSKLGIAELTDDQKIVLSYIEYMNEIFNYPTNLFVRFDYLDEYNRITLDVCSLHRKFLASMIYRTGEDIQRIVEELKRTNLVSEVDLDYTKGGYHRGVIIQLTEFGQKMAAQTKEDLKKKVEAKLKEVFSSIENRDAYYLFTAEKIPLKVLSFIKKENIDALQRAGLIGEKTETFIAFKEGTVYHNYIGSEISPERIKAELREKCAALLSREEKSFLGFLSECKNVVLGKYADSRAWGSVTTRTQRGYEDAYKSLVTNFPWVKKLFSYLTGLSIEEIENVTSSLEKNSFLVQEKISCSFPGHAIIYRIPVKFDFDIDVASLKSKVKDYVDFLSKDIEKHYNQLIFLDYLVQTYETQQSDFLVDKSSVKYLLEFLNHTPPSKYLPIYAFEDEAIVFHPLIKEELKKEIYETKLKLIEPIKTMILQLTEEYQNKISYNFTEKSTKEGYFIVEIESPDPSVGTVSFALISWATHIDAQKVSTICERSNTINIFVLYPNYPQIKRAFTNGKYNLFIIRGNVAYVFRRRFDPISETVFTSLGQQIKVIKEEEKVKDELEEIQEKFPNLTKVRNAVSEAEKLLRDAIRPRLMKEFGDNWQNRIEQRFPKAQKRKQEWEKEHPAEQTDILQGISMGDFITLFEDKTFSFIKDCFKNFGLINASLKVFLSKKEYHHGRPEKDLPQEEVSIVLTAFRNLKDLSKLS